MEQDFMGKMPTRELDRDLSGLLDRIFANVSDLWPSLQSNTLPACSSGRF